VDVIRDLQLIGGDLVASGRGFATVTGTDYVRQRVATALTEPYGSDPYHPEWGSALRGYLGAPQDAGTPTMLTSEVSRVLAQLIAAQQLLITASALAGTRSQLAAADVIASVDSVDAFQGVRPDAIAVAISLTTQGGQQLQVTRTVSS
jgi:phage baseplate assembly protein W